MTGALLFAGWQVVNVLALLAGARLGVVTLHVRKPTAPRTPEAGK